MQIVFTSNENSKRYFVELYKLFLNFIWKSEGPRIAKSLLKNFSEVSVGKVEW